MSNYTFHLSLLDNKSAPRNFNLVITIYEPSSSSSRRFTPPPPLINNNLSPPSIAFPL